MNPTTVMTTEAQAVPLTGTYDSGDARDHQRRDRWIVRVTLALALAAPVLLWSLDSFVSTDHSYTFEIQLASSANGRLQVYYDRGHGLSESESVSQIVVAGDAPERLSLVLPSGSYRMLRIDPPRRPGRFVIADARIRDWRGFVVQEIPLNDLQTVSQLARIAVGPPAVFESPPGTNSPQLSWQPPAPVTLALARQSLRSTVVTVFTEYFGVFLVVLLLERVLRPLRQSAEKLLAACGRAGARRPRTAILVAACVGTVIAMYPIVFAGKSLVSPNIVGTPLLYDRVPFTPGQRDHRVENIDAGVDVGATMWSSVPTSHLQRMALLEGELPLWNRYNSAGRPLWGQGLSMLMDPLHWVTIVTPNPALGWDLKFLIHRAVFAGGVGIAVLTLTGSWAGATVMALLAPFASQYLSRLSHPAQFALTYAPWVLWAWFRLASATTRRAIARSAGWLVVTTALLMVASPPKEAIVAILCTHVAGAASCFLSRAAFRIHASRLAAAVIAAFLAVLLTAPHWLPFVKTLAESFTAYDTPSVNFASLPFALSLAFGAIAQIGLPPGTHPIAAALALAALFFGRRNRGASSLGMAIGPAFALAIAFGAIPKQVMLKLPFFANIVHVDFSFAGAAVPLLMVSAGVAAAALLDTADTRRTRLDIRLSFAACVACSLVLISWGHGIAALSSHTSQWALVFAAVLAALFLLVARIAARDWPSPMPTIAAGVTALLLVTPDAVHVVFNIPGIDAIAIQPTGRADLDRNGAAVDAIHASMSDPARVLGLDATLFAGSQVLYEFESLGGADPLQLAPYEELINAAGVRRFWWWNQAISAQDLRREGPLLDLLNVDFVLTNHLDENEGLPEGADGLSILPMQGTDRVLAARRPHPWPRAFYVDAVSQYGDVNEFVRQLNGSDGPFASVQSSDEKARSVYTGTPSRRAAVPADQYVLTTNRTVFHLRTPGPGIAVLTEAWMADDFVATLNGVQKPYFRVNHAFKGIRIPDAGDWIVEFKHQPAGWRASLAMAAVGLVGLTVLWRL